MRHLPAGFNRARQRGGGEGQGSLGALQAHGLASDGVGGAAGGILRAGARRAGEGFARARAEQGKAAPRGCGPGRAGRE